MENIDAGIEIIKLQELNFYKEYKSVRKIISLGTGTIALAGKITDALTKKPIKNASIEFNVKVNGSNTPINTNSIIIKNRPIKVVLLLKQCQTDYIMGTTSRHSSKKRKKQSLQNEETLIVC